MSLTKRTVVRTVSCRYVVPSRTAGGGFIGGVHYDPAAEQISVEVERLSDASVVHLGGSPTALRAFGDYLVALSLYGSDDPAYHDHFDEAGLIAHGPPLDEHRTITADTRVEVEVTYLDDDRSGAFDASGLASPAHESELAVGVFEEDGRDQVHVRGTRRALAALGGYLGALSEVGIAGYHDTLFGVLPYDGETPTRLVMHAPTTGLAPSSK